MDQKEFLARVLPAGNHYIAYPGDKKDQFGRIIWNHRAFVEPYQGVQFSDQTASRNRDVYFAVASFKQAKVLDEKLGKEKSYRKQENVAELKCLFLDIDFKNYNSPEDTVAALSQFLAASQLEKPTIIVRTGGGLHVYWTFPVALPRDEWQTLADGLAGLAENLGLRADLQCTIDCARILRMPGTRNLKYDPAPLCEIVSSRDDDVDMEVMTRRLRGVTSMRARTGRGPKPAIVVDPDVAGMFADSQADDLGAGVGGESSMALMARPSGGCPMLLDMLIKGGAGYDYPLWNNMVLLASFATDGRPMAHLMSKGDPRYSATDTDGRFDEKLAEQGKGIGPTTCDTFALCGATQCAACPHRGKIKSPIQLSRAQPEPQVFTPPKPTYSRDGRTFIPVTRPGENGKPPTQDEAMLVDMEMAGTPVLNKMPTSSSAILEITFADNKGKLYRVALDTSRIPNREYLVSQFGARKIIIPRNVEKAAEAAMGAWVNQLRTSGAVASSSFGWLESVGDRTGFAIAGELYADDGQQYRVGIAPGFDRGFGVVGKPEPWRKLAELIIADERAEMQIGLATAFAAPLVELTELSATSVSLRSSLSGVGKTSVMRAAKAVYGDPDNMSHASDTATYVEATLAAQTNMPWYWDELRTTNFQQLGDTIHQILQGKSKGRAAPDGSAKPTLQTRGMLVMASNLSLHEIMQTIGLGTNAGSYRIFEIDVPARRDIRISSDFNKAMRDLKNNHGHAGVEYARYLATHRAEVEKVVELISAKVDEQYEAIQAERYWIVTVKTLLAGAVLACKAGVCQFDVPRMNECLKRLVRNARSVNSHVVSGEDLAGRIWRFFPNQQLITDTFSWKPGRPKNATALHPHPNPQFGHPCLRLAVHNDVLAIGGEAIEDYAKRNNLQAAIVLSQIASIPGCVKVPRVAIDSGISGSRSGRQTIYVMNATAVLGADMMQDLQRQATSAGSQTVATPGSFSGSAPSGSSVP